MNLVVPPDQTCFLQISTLGGIDTDQTAEAFTMLRILSDGDLDLFLV